MSEASPAISTLSRPTSTSIRSALVIPTLSQVVSELLQNSLDAGATKIDVWLGLSESDRSIRVQDDGHGISKESLRRIGGRHESSKSLSLSRLGPETSFDFRGEALSSIAALGLLEVTSKTQLSRPTYTKIIKNSKTLYEGTCSRPLSGQRGTVITVKDLFQKIPVRQSALAAASSTSLLASCRRVFEKIALAQPSVTFTLWEERNVGPSAGGGTKRIAELPAAKGHLERYKAIYGNPGVVKVQKIRVSSGRRRIDGFISLEGSVTKTHQHLFVNGFPIEKGDLHMAILKRFADSRFSSHAYDHTLLDEQSSNVRRSPRRLIRHPIFVLNVIMPADELDVAFEPRKAVLGFQDSESVKKLALAVVDEFLKRHDFTSSGDATAATNPHDSEVGDPYRGGSTSPMPKRSRIAISPSFNRIPTKRPSSTISHDVNERAVLQEPLQHRDLRRTITPRPVCRSASPRVLQQARFTTPSLGSNSCISRKRKQHQWIDDLLVEHDMGVLPFASPLTSQTLSDRAAPLALDNYVDEEQQRPCTNCRSPATQAPFHPLPPTTASLTFDDQTFTSPTILGQIDHKFLACMLDTAPREEALGKRALVLVDQHAADERISLEAILYTLCEGFIYENIEITPLTNNAPNIVLTRGEADILRREGMLNIFQRWGIHLDVPTSVSPLSDYVQVEVKAVPTIFKSRLGRQHASEMTRLVKIYLHALDEAQGELQAVLQALDRDPGGTSWDSLLFWMPREMVELANSKACRGAIMFGDSLDLDQCHRLLGKLAETKFPFMCAHGRPSLVPIGVIGGVREPSRRRINWSEWSPT